MPKKDPLGVLVVDEDLVWQKPVNVENEDEENSADEEKSQANDGNQVKRMKRRMEQIRSFRPNDEISEDRSGLISVSDTEKLVTTMQRLRRVRTPSPEEKVKSTDYENKARTCDHHAKGVDVSTRLHWIRIFLLQGKAGQIICILNR